MKICVKVVVLSDDLLCGGRKMYPCIMYIYIYYHNVTVYIIDPSYCSSTFRQDKYRTTVECVGIQWKDFCMDMIMLVLMFSCVNPLQFQLFTFCRPKGKRTTWNCYNKKGKKRISSCRKNSRSEQNRMKCSRFFSDSDKLERRVITSVHIVSSI